MYIAANNLFDILWYRNGKYAPSAFEINVFFIENIYRK